MLQVARGSWFEPLADLRSQLAGVLCNPPYIPSADISHLQVVPSVRCSTSPYSYKYPGLGFRPSLAQTDTCISSSPYIAEHSGGRCETV